ncbi:putative flagellin protein [Pseudomonas saudimassiliensis]|uniref:Flagellin n=1 Tax=Pseudomonas saudimassiliensis TaxID=1461581 RepID=A0A078MFE5_9PSED|nr:flagellin domain-containing protein [Pseudomonas saudimassiliensis]CEA06033.1 putative flagellin protein [Pseudomonas saudimassiliensis]CEF27458.1 putative flagellin protein [Pseudomonas saudimassiliensis]
MALTVNSNIASLNAQRNLSGSTNALTTAMERLSSGSRINSAKDDAAGLQISNRLTSQINGLNVATRNANDGISMAQVAEGALQESTTILQRMRELALQAENGANSAADKESLQKEVTQLSQELDRIANTTSFGEEKLLNGGASNAARSFQVGAYSSTSDTITLNLTHGTNEGFGASALGSTETDGIKIDAIRLAATTEDVDGTATEVPATTLAKNLEAIDGALATIDATRADLGAKQNRLSSTISNLQNISENVSASRSRIMDTDYAVETANLTKNQIMQQAGTAMLSQANQLPQAVLSLLG